MLESDTKLSSIFFFVIYFVFTHSLRSRSAAGIPVMNQSLHLCFLFGIKSIVPNLKEFRDNRSISPFLYVQDAISALGIVLSIL